jgi:hypothetical protein
MYVQYKQEMHLLYIEYTGVSKGMGQTAVAYRGV